MLSGEGGAASSTRFKSKRRSEGPDIFKGVEEVGQIKILEVQEWSFYWWRFKCALELNASPYKNRTRRSFRNRRGACSEIKEAFAFSKVRLLRYHKSRSQKSKRRLLSQKLGCAKTTKANLRNRRGAYFLKSWAAQRPRGPISKIEEAPTFPALLAPVTRTLSFAEIMGIRSKTPGEVEST
ncbi:hypothetical protein C1H46_001470 [Malus baccata]|uniref:Uncharacterized protein n=1 Tax=Malus baccata TaxID=106549 RepID=A0A540NP53_MALBA|nr:hypothetical protein C1H46_001470 [Malus baccata]